MKKVTKAVIPAAGLGTRVLPATKVAEAIAKYNIQADKVNPLYA